MTTNVVILMGRNALNMRGDCTVQVTDGGEQPFAKATSLLHENPIELIATFEPDCWLLDGNYRFADLAMNNGYMSSNLSNGSGVFFPVAPPSLLFTFGKDYSTNNIKIVCPPEDWAKSISISYIRANDTIIRTDTYTLTTNILETNMIVQNFRKVSIVINETNKPFRMGRITSIDFDQTIRWNSTNIKNAKLIEQIDPVSLVMPSNELVFTIFSDEAGFSATNPSPQYASLQQEEPIEVYEQISNSSIFMGRFYLSDWESLNDKEAKFTAVDAITLLEMTPFYCTANGISQPYGIYYVDELILKLMQAAGFEYTIDSSLIDIPLWNVYSGMMKTMNCRKALQQACIVLGAYATCSRSRKINIVPFRLGSSLMEYDHTIMSGEKGIKSSVMLRRAVTSVEVIAHEWARIYYDQAKEVYDQTLQPGNYVLTFDIPSFYALNNSTAVYTRNDYGRYWVDITVTVTGTIVVEDTYYFKAMNEKRVLVNTGLPAGTLTNIIRLEDAELVTTVFVNEVLQRLYAYFIQRHVQKTRLFGKDIKVGQSVLIETQSNKHIKGIVERAEFDLTGGFVSDVEIVGVVV